MSVHGPGNMRPADITPEMLEWATRTFLRRRADAKEDENCCHSGWIGVDDWTFEPHKWTFHGLTTHVDHEGEGSSVFFFVCQNCGARDDFETSC